MLVLLTTVSATLVGGSGIPAGHNGRGAERMKSGSVWISASPRECGGLIMERGNIGLATRARLGWLSYEGRSLHEQFHESVWCYTLSKGSSVTLFTTALHTARNRDATTIDHTVAAISVPHA